MKQLINKQFNALIFSCILLSSLSMETSATEPLPNKPVMSYSFGVVPQQSAKRLATLWGPVLNYLSEKTGIKLQFKTAKDIPTFEKRLSSGEYDFAYMNPYHFIIYNDKPGYKAIAVRKNQPISGILVAKKNSGIESLQTLSEKTLAFPSPAAFAASILPQAELNKQNIRFEPKYVSSHDSVYLAVAKGLIPAGGGVKRTFNNTPQAIKKQLRIIWTSKQHTPHAFAYHPGINIKAVNAIKKALTSMSNDPIGKKLLESLKIKNGLIPAIDSDWNDIKALDIDLLDKTN